MRFLICQKSTLTKYSLLLLVSLSALMNSLSCTQKEPEQIQIDMKQKFQLIEQLDRDGDHFLTIAHRGASAYYPENTMAAFEAAIDMKADMMELDILLSKDGKLVVIHDETLDRTTNGTGPVAEHTLAELKQLDAGSWFDKKFKGEPIPTLREALELAKDSINVNIEIKTEAIKDDIYGGIEEKALKLVDSLGMRDQVIFSSFDYRAIAHLNQLDPEIPVAVLYNKSLNNPKTPSALVDSLGADGFNCSYKQLSNRWIRNTVSAGIPLLVYTVNRELRMQTVIKRGVAGIFSDKPDLLKKTALQINQEKH